MYSIDCRETWRCKAREETNLSQDYKIMPGIFWFNYKLQNMLTSRTVLLPKRNKHTLVKIQTLVIEDAQTQEFA